MNLTAYISPLYFAHPLKWLRVVLAVTCGNHFTLHPIHCTLPARCESCPFPFLLIPTFLGFFTCTKNLIPSSVLSVIPLGVLYVQSCSCSEAFWSRPGGREGLYKLYICHHIQIPDPKNWARRIYQFLCIPLLWLFPFFLSERTLAGVACACFLLIGS